jgi:hypothetical protein
MDLKAKDIIRNKPITLQANRTLYDARNNRVVITAANQTVNKEEEEDEEEAAVKTQI